MSHELRTPMHAILSFASMGEEKSDSASREKLQHYFANVHRSGEQLLLLLNDLFDLSILETGRMKFDFQEYDISQLVDSTISEFSEQARMKSLHLEVLPSKKTDTLIECDHDKLFQVMRNLISNAIKFTPEGNSLRISYGDATLPAKRRHTDTDVQSAIAVSITDEGIGIPEDELEKVFDKFEQSSKTHSGNGGTGLRLATCREIVNGHKGKIWAENSPRGGTVLYVCSFLVSQRKYQTPDYVQLYFPRLKVSQAPNISLATSLTLRRSERAF